MAETAAATRHIRTAAWTVLITMGGESLAFNVYHALNGDPAAPAAAGHAAQAVAAGHAAHAASSGHLTLVLAVLYGLAPVAAAMGLSHIAAASRDRAVQAVTYLVMLGAMGLSMGATASVVGPVAGPVWKWVFPLVMDAAALVALRVIIDLAAARIRGSNGVGEGATNGLGEGATNGVGEGATNGLGEGATNGATRGATTADWRGPSAPAGGRPLTDAGRATTGATKGATSGAASAASWPRQGATTAATNGGHAGHGASIPGGADNPVARTPDSVVHAVNFGGEIGAKRGGMREEMRKFWDEQTSNGCIPNGADLNRSVGRDPGYSLGKRYAAEWRAEMDGAPSAGEGAQ